MSFGHPSKNNPIKSIWMKVKLTIFKTCSLIKMFLKNKKNPLKTGFWKQGPNWLLKSS
jgi:hypothetical protein